MEWKGLTACQCNIPTLDPPTVRGPLLAEAFAFGLALRICQTCLKAKAKIQFQQHAASSAGSSSSSRAAKLPDPSTRHK